MATPARIQRTLSRTIAAGGAVLLVLAWVVTAIFLHHEHVEAIAHAARTNGNLARALQESTLRVLDTVDQSARRMGDALRQESLAPAEIVRIANETGLVPEILVQLAVVGPDGRFIGSNLDPDAGRTGRIDLSSREHIRVHLGTDPRDTAARALLANGLFIGKPVLGKVSGRWTIQVSRAVRGPQGELLGVIVASVDPSYFESVYRGVDLGRRGIASLVGRDGTVRARVVDGRSEGMGSVISSTSPVARGSQESDGTYVAASGVDGISRVYAFQRVKGYPIYIFVGTALEVAEAGWVATRNIALSLMGLLSVMMTVALYMFVNGVRRLELSNRQLAASEAQAQQANQAKTEFLAAVSHELRTPLTSIRGFAELMEARIEQPRFREQAGMIRRSAQYLNVLLTEILDLAKVEAGEMQVRTVPVAVRPLLQSTADFFGVTAVERGLSLRVQIADDVPDTVPADDLRIKQILNNLMSNALKFTAVGGITLAAEREGGDLCIHVMDTGPGIPQELHELIFERFRQASAKVASEHGGTGLGLALARALATLMGGLLTVRSSVGEGARFTLRLPLQSGPD